MTDTTITFSMNKQELALVKTSIALTLSSINTTIENSKEKISLSEDALEDLYRRFHSLQSKLKQGRKKRK